MDELWGMTLPSWQLKNTPTSLWHSHEHTTSKSTIQYLTGLDLEIPLPFIQTLRRYCYVCYALYVTFLVYKIVNCLSAILECYTVLARWQCKCLPPRLWNETVKDVIPPLLWRHNGHDSVSNHQHHDCLLNRLFRRRKYQSSASLAFVRGNHRRPVNSPHKWPVTRRMFSFDDVKLLAYLA